MNLRQLLYILRLRWWLVLLIIAGVVGGTYAVSVRLPKVYIAETSLLLDVKSDPLVATFMPAIATPAYLATQIEIISSERVASQVVQVLGVDKHEGSLTNWREETQGKVPVDRFFGDLLLKGLTVQAGRNSSVVNIAYASGDPKFAAAAANAFAQAYLSTSASLRVEPARQYAGWFEEQTKSLRSDLERAQSRLSAASRKSGIVASPERIDVETARLDALNAQLASAIAERTETQARQRFSGDETSPDVQNSGAVQSIKQQISAAETKLSEVSSIVGARHPQRVQLEAQLAELRQQLTAEMRRVSGTTATVSRQSGQKVEEVRAQVEAQKRTVLAMRSQLDELSLLQREVDTAQRAYDAVAQRRSQLSLEGQSEQAGARVLSQAVEPLDHAKPRILINVLVSLVVGTGLAIAVALGMELMDRRLRAPSDLQGIEGAPLLGVLTPPGKRNKGRVAPVALMRPRADTTPRLTMSGGPV